MFLYQNFPLFYFKDKIFFFFLVIKYLFITLLLFLLLILHLKQFASNYNK